MQFALREQADRPAPPRRALMAAHNATLPPPTTIVSNFFSVSMAECQQGIELAL
jgi:hypothetical protein